MVTGSVRGVSDVIVYILFRLSFVFTSFFLKVKGTIFFKKMDAKPKMTEAEIQHLVDGIQQAVDRGRLPDSIFRSDLAAGMSSDSIIVNMVKLRKGIVPPPDLDRVGLDGSRIPYFFTDVTTEKSIPMIGCCGRTVKLQRLDGGQSFARVRSLSKRCRAEQKYLRRGMKFRFLCSFYITNTRTKVYVICRQ